MAARQAHNLKAGGSSPPPATRINRKGEINVDSMSDTYASVVCINPEFEAELIRKLHLKSEDSLLGASILTHYGAGDGFVLTMLNIAEISALAAEGFRKCRYAIHKLNNEHVMKAAGVTGREGV